MRALSAEEARVLRVLVTTPTVVINHDGPDGEVLGLLQARGAIAWSAPYHEDGDPPGMFTRDANATELGRLALRVAVPGTVPL